ncbi:MAG: STAS domain-containing protein [Alphaproteobacteria bacterium]|nr:STAS domain-containing protein [Alphaproteobacteria bacterium]
MELVREDIGNVAVIRCLEERLDAIIAVQFKDRFRDLTDEASQHFVLDMSRVQFMDSSGLGAVVAVYKFLGREKRFDIAGLTPMVERVFKLTRMDSVFTIYKTMDEMLASVAAVNDQQKAS